MPKFTGNENVPNSDVNDEAVFEYVTKHADTFKLDLLKVFKYVGDNKRILKPYIDESIVSSIRLWVSEGLGCSYEDVAIRLDEKTLKQFLGDEWFNL